MEKEALINIILNDLNEIHTLVSTFKGKNNISKAFINLARTKLTNIGEELNLLESLQNEQMPDSEISESSLTSSASLSTPLNDAIDIAESSGKFISGEANEEPSVPKEIKQKVSVDESPKPTEEPITEKDFIKEDLTPPKMATPVTVTSQPATANLHEGKDTLLGDKIKSEVQSLNEKIAVKKENTHVTQIGKPVDDVRKAIGLNDRFYYQRELFDGNADLFNQTLDQLNAMQTYDTALQFLHSNFNWDNDNEVAQSFLKNIQRRFI